MNHKLDNFRNKPRSGADNNYESKKNNDKS